MDIYHNGKTVSGAGATDAADLKYNNSNTGLPATTQGAIDKTTGNISSLDTVELTATAAHHHAVGSTFLWIGQFVKTTAAIAVGDTIAIGTNVVSTNVSSILTELNSNLSDYIIVAVHSFANTGSVPAGDFKSITEPVQSRNGYTPIVAIPYYSGNNQFTWVGCSTDGENVTASIRNDSSSADSGYPSVVILFRKNI